MQINSIGPSFNGYIKIREVEGTKWQTERIFNTNNITIKNFSNLYSRSDYGSTTSIIVNDREYNCNVSFKRLQEAILIADSHPHKIIDVENFEAQF